LFFRLRSCYFLIIFLGLPSLVSYLATSFSSFSISPIKEEIKITDTVRRIQAKNKRDMVIDYLAKSLEKINKRKEESKTT